ncbi:hypothetical protein [Photobacterium damselae]|uniref:hypothetical protein n=1 Tax=Photobacterium damselae TaxID=38293 RepID=UPI0010FD4666|nr:hypothetical protein [Photobacterium damselae]TLS84315.1 hypothetical protein FD720_17350 [Photobacterium damselae subsp. damselae]
MLLFIATSFLGVLAWSANYYVNQIDQAKSELSTIRETLAGEREKVKTLVVTVEKLQEDSVRQNERIIKLEYQLKAVKSK